MSFRRSDYPFAMLGLITIIVSLTSCSSNSQSGNDGSGSVALIGSGSTFVKPAMDRWTYDFNQKNPSITINYQAVGSGAGISNYKQGVSDFGATDAPLSDIDLKQMPTPTLQLPVAAGCEVIGYNIPGVKSGLKFTGEILANIYLGKIVNWNDPTIAAANPDITLPNLPIVPFHRSDASGTSFIFTTYLSAVSQDWKTGPGIGKTVNWPNGNGANGNQGVATNVKNQAGGIGYIELAYALGQGAGITYGNVQGGTGDFVVPTIDSTSAAVDAAKDALAKDNRSPIVFEKKAGAYPIVGMTYMLISEKPSNMNPAKQKALLDFVNYCLGDGQKTAGSLSYGPLPESLVDLNKKALSEVK